jgi:hypothetical protein
MKLTIYQNGWGFNSEELIASRKECHSKEDNYKLEVGPL